MGIHFRIDGVDGKARAGVLTLPGNRNVETPVFMPVGTQAVVKSLDSHDLEALQVQLLLANAYHLHLRPGAETIAAAGGLHRFMGWPGGIITDSGGYQVFSLADFRTVGQEGVSFVSHLDGSKHFFTPETNMELQHQLGADIIMAFDVCVAYPAGGDEVRRAVELTTDWAGRCLDRHAQLGGEQALFGIVQGGVLKEARTVSAQALVAMDFPGYAIGGLSVGEGPELMNEILDHLHPLLPEGKPRYLMGVGTPLDLWEAAARGVDMLDCAMPTRIARNGTLFTSRGRLVIKNAAYARDERPPDPDCACPLCRRHSRAYLRHLFNTQELTALRLSTLHNLTFMLNLSRFIRKNILSGTFESARQDFLSQYGQLSTPAGAV
ncbi:MAG: tRNA guanosine(34) transglycosylase Tgt [candidate division FCPU426 bacterium]